MKPFKRTVAARMLSWLVSVLIVVNPFNAQLSAARLHALLATATTFAPALAFAEAFDDAARVGQAAGRTMTQGVTVPGVAGDGTVTGIDVGGGAPLNINEIFPDTGVPTGDLNGYFGRDQDLLDAGLANQSILANDPGTTGDAYRLLDSTARERIRYDLEGHPMWNATDSVLSADSDALNSLMSGCARLEQRSTPTSVEHIPDFHSCERVPEIVPACSLSHPYSIERPLANATGILQMQSCPDMENCLMLTVGAPGTGYQEGECSVFEQSAGIEVLNPDAIVSARLEQAVWEDYIQVVLNGKLVFQGPDTNFPPETASGNCDLNTAWDEALTVDLTSAFKQGGTLGFKVRSSVTGAGHAYARIRVVYDHMKLRVSDEGWESGLSRADYQACKFAANCVADGFCSGALECTSGMSAWQAPPADPGACINLGGMTVCPDDPIVRDRLQASPSAGINPLCGQVNITAERDYFIGQAECFEDINGILRCPTSDGSTIETSCEPLETNTACTETVVECVEDAEGPSGNCYVSDVTFDCGYDVEVMGPTTITETFQCDGAVRCMGSDCVTHRTESNQDFAEVAGILGNGTHTLNDMECVEGAGCTFYNGERYKCKKVLGGIVDCCEKPENISIADYMELGMNVIALNDQIAMMGSMGGPSFGAWTDMTDALGATWDTVSQPFVSAWESFAQTISGGSSSQIAGALGDYSFGAIKKAITNQLAEWVGSIFGEAVQSSLFTQSANGAFALGGQGAWLGTILYWIMFIYAIIMIIIILIQLIWECEDREFELGVKRQLKMCHKRGSYCSDKIFGSCIEKKQVYCCFASPLARIMQQQIRAQLGIGWGRKKRPNCGGLSASTLSRVNWDALDLSEWHALQTLGGQVPDSFASAESAFTLERITGRGFTGTWAPDARDRAAERINVIDPEAVRKSANANEWSGIGAVAP